MSAGAPWSVKGIDPKAREVAKDLARRSGMTLGEWLNRVILEDDVPEEITAEAHFADRPLRVSQDAPRLRVVPPAAGPDQARVAAALDRLTDRIEESETRTGLAIHGVEHSVRQALARIDTAERQQHAASARLEGLLADASAEQSGFGERLRRIEAAAGPRSAEALRALEGRLARAEPELVIEAVLQRLGERLAAAEANTGAALEDLKGSLAAFDRRLGSVEQAGGAEAELKFEALAQVLTHRVEAVRAEVAEKLAAATGESVEARFAELTEQVRAAERRSARAVEDIGRQVLSMAEAVGRKLSEVDEKSAEAIDQVGTEVARIAGAVELRLGRGEQAQAQAFERLSAELARVTETLSERLSVSERRAADALDGVGEHMARVDARFAAPEPAVPPVAPVVAAAPAPPSVAIPEALHSLGPPPEPEPEPESAPTPGVLPQQAAAFGPELFSRAEPDPDPETVTPPWRRLDLDVPDPDIPEAFAPIPGEDDDLFADADPLAAQAAAAEAASGGPELSTREVIDRARAAARAAQEKDQDGDGGTGPGALDVRAKVGRAATGRLFQGFGKPRRPAKPARNTALQTALMIAGGAAFLSVGAAGLTLMQGPSASPTDARTDEALLSPSGPAPRAAMALGPAALASAPDGRATPGPSGRPVFAEVQADVEAGVPGALAALHGLAEAGDAQAQLYLAQLHDAGEAGLPRNAAEARRLTTLAAQAGNVQAMHNLAVYEFRAEGGPQDLPGAVRWFRKAAAAGLVESQYNLGLLYQSGSGVARDLDEARRWFAAAAAKGDAEARRALTQMTPAPGAKTAPPPQAGAASMNVRQTQLLLGRLGYYDGPADGRASPAYQAALADYRRAQAGSPYAGPR